MKAKTIPILFLLAALLAAPAAMADDAKVTTDGAVTVVDGGAASQPAAEPTDPNVPTTDNALDKGKQLVELAKAKQWFAFSAGTIWLLMFLFKLGRKKLAFMSKIPKRVLWIILPLLSVAAMVLAKLQADLSWGAAFGVATSGPAVAFLNDFVKRGLLNKEPSPMKPGG